MELIPEKLDQYHLNMSAIASSISAANFSYPAGSAIVGSQDLSVTTAVEYDTMESLKQIPISAGNGNTIYLEDVANIYGALEDASSTVSYTHLPSTSALPDSRSRARKTALRFWMRRFPPSSTPWDS